MLNQPLLALPPTLVVRARSVRRTFTPGETHGRYRLPHKVQVLLRASLSGFRNRDAAWMLATFLGRYWAVPTRLDVMAFPIDRRALADRADLGLTEAQVRGAIATLEAVGFLDRDPIPGSRYQPTTDGLHRKPSLFRFGAAGYLSAFRAATARSEAARGPLSPARRMIGHEISTRQPLALIKVQPEASEPRSPKEISSGTGVSMGEVTKRLPTSRMSGPPEPSPLEAALARLANAIVKGDRS